MIIRIIMEWESINYKHRSQSHPRGLDAYSGGINDVRKELSTFVEIRRDNRKVMNIRRTRLLKKYNIEKTEELDQLIEELKGFSKDTTII